MSKKRKNKYPGLESWILNIVLPETDTESLNGDFLEIYFHYRKKHGFLRARFWLWKQILKSVPLFILNSVKWSFIMFSNYLKIAFRNIRKQKGYSFINIFGLSVGLTVSILVLGYIQFEMSFDKYHVNSKNIYRVLMNNRMRTPPGTGSLLKENFPEVKNTACLKKEKSSLSYKTNSFVEDRFYFTNQGFLDIFSFRIIRGSKENVLNLPNALVITEDMAAKYFWGEDPVGKVMSSVIFEKKINYTVMAVIENTPENSHFKFDFLASMRSLGSLRGERYITSYDNFAYVNYVLLEKNTDIKEFKKNAESLIDNRFSFRNRFGVNNEGFFDIQPISDIHLGGNRGFELDHNSSVKFIYIIISVGVTILLIACFNYINLSTARSIYRAGEIGIRKALGANRKMLFFQFMSESVIFSFLGFLISLILVPFLTPFFSSLVGSRFGTSFQNETVLLLSLVIFLFTGIFSGFYPSFVLSNKNPLRNIKSRLIYPGKAGQVLLRNCFVSIQLILSIILIVSALFIYKQLNYIKSGEIGYNKEYVITALIGDKNLKENLEPFKKELLSNPNVKSISFSTGILTDIGWATGVSWEGQEPGKNLFFFRLGVDLDFLDLYEMEIIKGRGFSKNFQSAGQTEVILNETAVKKIGWENPIGKRFTNGVVIGVVKDFHCESFHTEIKPVWITVNEKKELNYFVSAKLLSGNISETIFSIESIWKKFSPDYPFEFSFVDDQILKLYESEKRMDRTIKFSMIVAILLSCLGLFGLASFTASKRMKEISIRKVMGASVTSILLLLIKSFLRLCLISTVIAAPAALFFVNKWLSNFEYRIKTDIFMILPVFLTAVIIVLISVGYQSLKAAYTNPVDSLRNE
ncbi:FtsX-like permease family protein [candidate division KSB1 bacterium]